MFGGDGSDTFLLSAGGGADAIDGGAGASWTDTIALDAFGARIASDVARFETDDWTVSLSSGRIVSESDGALVFSEDAAGSVTFDDTGESVAFANVEGLTWNG